MPKPPAVHIGTPAIFALALLAATLATGCAMPLQFPTAPLSVQETPDGHVRSYAVTHPGKADSFATENADGRTVRIAYDPMGEGKPTTFVNLDEIRLPDCRHVVIVLDGMPYDVVEAYRKKGGLRLFYPPSRMIPPYPAFTDLSLSDAFASARCFAFEALHFDHHLNRIVGGDSDYLSMKNESWARKCDYRADTLYDAISYMYPEPVFHKELADVLKLLDLHDRSTVIMYFVSTAGLATRQGEAGQIKIIEAIDRFCEEMTWRTRGLMKFTIFSDHGHTMQTCKRIDFKSQLTAKGWRVADHLEKPRDVVLVEYGLVTNAIFCTKDRPALAGDLAQVKGVRFACYEDGGTIAVRAANGNATIERRGDSFRYRAAEGDPLKLLSIFEKLKADGKLDADGFAPDRVLFDATATHIYPDACERLWRGFHGLVEEVPDVIADIDRGYFAGMESRANAVGGTIASTHGDLERVSSTAVLMSTAGPLPPILRVRDLPKAMQMLTGQSWPPAAEKRGK